MAIDLKRKIEDDLKRWKEESKTALLLLGARQTGKTYALRQLGNGFPSFVDLNFADHPEWIDMFARLKSPEDIIVRLSSIEGEGQKLIPHKTMVLLDEIQLVYERREKIDRSKGLVSLDLLTAMKRLSEKGEYRFALSGSLLGATLKNIVLYPAGYMEEMRMYPLDFEEYLLARGIGESAITYLKDCFDSENEVDEDMNAHFLDLFREYVLIGGMPKPVSLFEETKNLSLVATEQGNIVKAYEGDMTRYVEDVQLRLSLPEVYRRIPGELNKSNKRFVFSHALSKAELKRIDPADRYLWLKAAGIVIPVYAVDEPLLPLSSSEERKTMKLFYNDVGLLSHSLVSDGIREKLLNNEESINYGAPYENAAAELLSTHGYEDSLFYWNSKRNGEVDFLLETLNGVLPIEIKSGKPKVDRYYNHSALNNLIKTYKPKKAMVFGNCNVKRESDTIVEYPIYMLDFLRK